MATYDGIIDPVAAWVDVQQLSTTALLKGGVGGPLNQQATELAARTKFLDAKIDALGADDVDNVPAGTISSTTVQGAINELDSDISAALATLSTKANISHTHTTSNITGLDDALSNLAAQISAGGSGTVTSVVVSGTVGRISSSGGPVTTSGNISLDLVSTGVTTGSYTNVNMTVDAYGRVTAVSNGSSSTGLGYGQTWQNVTRTEGTVYTNATGKPIVLCITSSVTGGGSSTFIMTIDGVAAGRCSPLGYQGGGGTYVGSDTFIIPEGASYRWDQAGFGSISNTYTELR